MVEFANPDKVEALPEGSNVDELLDKPDDEFAAALGFQDETDEAFVKEKPEVKDAEKEATEKKEALKNVPIEQQVGDEEGPQEPGEGEKKTEEEVAAETKAEAEKKEEEVKLLTDFTVVDEAGEQVDPKSLKFKLDFKANKKDYNDVPIDKVVLLAKMGVYNQDKQDEVENSKRYVAEVAQVNKALRTAVDELRSEFDDLLSNEEYRDAAVEQFAKQNTPEEKARKERDELARQRQDLEHQQRTQVATEYIATNIQPAITQILHTYPSVSEDEMLGRFNRLITPYLVNGVVQPHNLPRVKEVVDTELNMWAQSIHLEREDAKQVVEKRVQSEKTKTALEKKRVARVVKPRGKAAKTQRKSKTYASAEDWANRAPTDILEESLGE